MRKGRAKVQQQTATYQDNQKDLTVRVIAIQNTTHALAELAAIQHTGSPHHRESVRAPVKRVYPNTFAPVVQPTIKDITLPPRESTCMNHRRRIRFRPIVFESYAVPHALRTSVCIVKEVLRLTCHIHINYKQTPV